MKLHKKAIKDIEILPEFITPEMIEFFMGIELID
jgi:hypothetical protein